MSTESVLQNGSELLKEFTVEQLTPEEHRLDLVIKPEDLTAAVSRLQQAGWGYLAGITGLDPGVKKGEDEGNSFFEVLYHFCSGRYVLTLRARVSRKEPKIASICGIIPSASFFERELMEMFGITVVDTPNPERLFLPDSWPEGVYPLRKDFAGREVTA